jgi:glycine/D-amino acid oxidase-like deaminating enzyme
MQTVKKVVVVGGGTAGWLAALILSDAAKRAKLPIDVSVVESPVIPSIGVGEGTTAVFKSMLDYFGFDEFDFLRETRGTIKYGIRHRDWAELGHTYDGPIDDPHALVEGMEPGSEILNIYAVAAGRRLADIHLFGHLMRGAKAPYAMDEDGKLTAVGPFQYAYHIDNASVGQYLRKKAKGIEQVSGTVCGSSKDPETGNITSLNFEEGGGIEGDFFVDCTGFRRRLIAQEMGDSWVSYNTELPVNRAMPFWIDHKEGEEIAPVTLAWAQKYGWMWQIPTADRLGRGYVYSDAFISPDEAQAEIEAILGHPIEPRADLKFDVGRSAHPWIGNCLAVGLSQSFLEPLEATSIHGTLVQMMLFTQDYMKDVLQGQQGAHDTYNDRLARQLDDFRNFINIHYFTRRDDSEFWTNVRTTNFHAESQERLDHWKREMPKGAHFTDGLSGLPHIEAQLYYPVLDGLGLLDQSVARQEMDAQGKTRQMVKSFLDGTERRYRAGAAQAMGHREFLEYLANQ